MSPTHDDLDDRRTMRFWISTVLSEARDKASVDQKEIAMLAGVDLSTINRFENHQTWPRTLDRIVAAYALSSGVDDGRTFWREATQRYIKQGGVPLLGELTPAQRSLRLALEAAQRQSPYDDGSQSERNATPLEDQAAGSRRLTRQRSR